MAYQTGKAITVAMKVEATFNTAPGASGAEQLRVKASPGATLEKALINSEEVRSDGLSSIARHGSRRVPVTYNAELSVDTFDTFLEAVMRSTWVAATTITVDGGGALTSFTVNDSNTVTLAGSSSLLTLGLRRGDVCRFTNMSTAANNSINFVIASVTANTFDTYGTPLTTQGADSAATLTILRKLKNGTTPTERTFYVEEYHGTPGVDVSEVFGGVKWTGFTLRGTPDGMAELEMRGLGASATTLASGASPYYSSPTLTTTIPLVFADATINYNGTNVATCTAWELTYDITADTQPVIGASVSPDIFANDARLTGTVSLVREDLTRVGQFINETELEFHVLLVEPESEPKDCVAFYVPYLKLTGATADLGADGAMIETLPWTAGVRPTTSGYDASLLTISTSAS